MAQVLLPINFDYFQGDNGIGVDFFFILVLQGFLLSLLNCEQVLHYFRNRDPLLVRQEFIMIFLHLLLETCLEFGPKRLGLRKVVFYDVGDHVQCDDSILLQFFVFLLLFVQKEIILSLLLLFLHLRDKLPLNLLWTLHLFQV